MNPARQPQRGETVLLHNIGGGTADGFLQNLRRGDPILVDQRPVTFLYWISRTAERKAHPSSTHPGVMVVASADSITAPGWPPPEARDGQFVYRIDPAAPTPLLVSPRVPPPPVVTSEPAVDGAAGLGLPRQAGEPRR